MYKMKNNPASKGQILTYHPEEASASHGFSLLLGASSRNLAPVIPKDAMVLSLQPKRGGTRAAGTMRKATALSLPWWQFQFVPLAM